jgi:predicted house-cleaning noncanonical NTP pyrophosphatase (MazG superfamily)
LPKYNKLVRDLITDIIKISGRQAVTRLLNKEEYLDELYKKAHEELDGFASSKSIEEIKVEMVDLLEVILTISKLHGFELEEIEPIRERKAKEKGGFEKNFS